MNNIRILRVKNFLSQEELAKQVHVTQTAVSQWEKGKTNPDIKTAGKLAELFGVSLDYLLGQETDIKNNSFYSGNICDSNFIHNNNGSMTVTSDIKISKEESEILRIYRILDVRDRAKLMNTAFELEDKKKKQCSETEE